ncbi:acetylglutamate kinase [Tenacibaculum tangerinum]|uniref:Acetylglutamate kinase n=1 Tax=Tenacibaculum tangerinum TaxID=3038772 RepID=A0ABY8L4C8_9FLAO|nr:acetylglutamate kinase [Tenacibaculum tangerinum]WGH76283.1 acetylglutamate kinase [Tenacibaculum tangerinum]
MKTIKIVKIGGNIINNEKALHSFLADFAELKGPKVLVHGGGKLASEMATKLNIPVTMIEGRRVTDAQTLDVITMVYAGKINKQIVAQLQAHNTNAVGFTGADGNTIVSVKRPAKPIDYGFAGDVITVNPEIPTLLINNDVTPVFCAITHTKNGQLLNTNADTIASEIAIGLSNNFATELYYCFEKPGVLTDVENDDSVIEHINIESYRKLKADGVIFEGMLPKLDNCFHALKNKVKTVHIGSTAMLFNSKNKHTSLQLL